MDAAPSQNSQTSTLNSQPTGDNSAVGPSVQEPDPIQPGQFVIAPQDNEVKKQAPTPKLSPVNTPANFASAQTAQAQPSAKLASPTPRFPNQSANLPNTKIPQKEFLTPPPPTQPVFLAPQVAPEGSVQQNFPAGFPKVVEKQPNPAPYAAPQSEDTLPEEPSKIKKIRMLAISSGILVLIGLIAGVSWFFILGKNLLKPVNTEIDESQIEEPPPLPKRTTSGGGFANLPPVVLEATSQATSEGASQLSQ